MKFRDTHPDLDPVVESLGKPGTQWIKRGGKKLTIPSNKLYKEAQVWWHIMASRLMSTSHLSDITKEWLTLLYAVMTGMMINVGKVIFVEM